MAASSSFPIPLLLLLSILSFSLISHAVHDTAIKSINLEHPAEDVFPSSLPGAIDIKCDRVRISGISRLKLGSFASSFRVTAVPSVVIPERQHTKIQVCFHWNNTLGLCQCEDDEWKTFQKGSWSCTMSPYEVRYVDVKVIDATPLSGPVTIAIEEDFQEWRLLCLALGFMLLLLAPVVSSWVPFYYSSSMAIGIFLVVLIILFQGMKLLPTGRKSAFYLTVYGSVLGAGSYLVHHFAMLVNSILLSFGLKEEMHNPVAIFLLLGIVLSGAALGFWIVRKFVISEDGNVDIGVAQFVKWAMRIIGATSIFQSTPDAPLALGAFVCCSAACYLISSLKQRGSTPSKAVLVLLGINHILDLVALGNGRTNKLLGSGFILNSLADQALKTGRGEFLIGTAQFGRIRLLKVLFPTFLLAVSSIASAIVLVNRLSFYLLPSSLFDVLLAGVISSSSGMQDRDYYSTFHKTRNRKKFSKKAWDDFTRDSTRQALTEWASSPEFTDWIMEHADRIQLLRSDGSDEAVGSESDSTNENVVGGSRFSFLNW
ncbi:putative transmembrane protein [Cucumis melo var. makuwa]|uniref:Transmembrane protein n=1 Tax=Cucumis melo var. makuwa TaxID=1194695 RepID=A0A5D3DU95_CUCMM|nr:putative transmembrane protein [Cucumis melo var. makuwa]TYK27082.1 putative transmembrane protein [Cucumis melo var. makuwa]